MFDTLRYAKVLQSAGIPREHAEAQIQIIAEIVEADLTTKQDLKELEYRLIIKLGTLVTAVVAAAVMFLKLTQ